ncbi:MAG: GntR family transcriptional regulator [Actinobacteria bacterium]|nr:GntR family transcriptional regulator [Actinomycetota bacterium]
MAEARPDFTPAYFRLAQDIKVRIENGDLAPGERVPSTSELAREYGISHMTVRRGLELLEREGYIQMVQGKGSFVAQRHMDFLVLDLRENDILGESRNYRVELREVEVVAADGETAARLDLRPKDTVLRIKRVVFSASTPLALDVRILPYIKGAPVLEREIAYAAFPDLVARHTELNPIRNILEIYATTISGENARQLKVRQGAHVLCVEQVIQGPGNRPLGCSRMYCREEKVRLRAVSQGR